MNINKELRLTAKTFHGLENTLAKELNTLNAKHIKTLNRAVQFTGKLPLMCAANYNCRTALSILIELTFFKAHNEDYLYRKAKQVKWENYLSPEQKFSISKTVNSKYFKHSHFAALRLKDAIADYFNEKYGKRPSVDTQNPDIVIDLHISHTNVNISLDTSGQALFKRNYRKKSGQAPINEVLAAGLILNIPSIFEKKLFDPFCGSGTIPAEYTLMALNIPAGYQRNKYAFLNYPKFKKEIFEEVKFKADKKIKSDIPASVISADIDPKMIAIAQENFENAGISEYIELKQADFFKSPPPEKAEILLFNPPYNKRLPEKNINTFYKSIGDTLKQKYTNKTAFIFSGFAGAAKTIGLRTSSRKQFYNGKIDSRLLEYEILSGTLKNKTNKKQEI